MYSLLIHTLLWPLRRFLAQRKQLQLDVTVYAKTNKKRDAFHQVRATGQECLWTQLQKEKTFESSRIP